MGAGDMGLPQRDHVVNIKLAGQREHPAGVGVDQIANYQDAMVAVTEEIMTTFKDTYLSCHRPSAASTAQQVSDRDH